MSVFLLQAGYIVKLSNDDFFSFADMIYGDKAWITPVWGWRGMRYPNKRWVADVEIDNKCAKHRYFRNRKRAERWARRFTTNIRHL